MNKRTTVPSLPRLYQQCTNCRKQFKNSQKTVKIAKKWPLVYQSSQVYQDCTNNVGLPIVKNKSKTVKRQSKQQKWPSVYQSSHVYLRPTTVPTVYQSSKTVKTAKMTIGVPIVTCLHRVRRINKAPPARAFLSENENEFINLHLTTDSGGCIQLTSVDNICCIMTVKLQDTYHEALLTTVLWSDTDVIIHHHHYQHIYLSHVHNISKRQQQSLQQQQQQQMLWSSL